MTARALHGRPLPETSPACAGPLGWLVRTLDWVAEAHERSRQRAVLAGLDDRMLRDIGLSRGQALAEARRPFWE